MSDAAHPDVSLEIDQEGVELESVITPQDFLPGGSSDWARLRFAGLRRGFELVVGGMVGVIEGAEERERASSFKGGRSRYVWLNGNFEMVTRLECPSLNDELPSHLRACDPPVKEPGRRASDPRVEPTVPGLRPGDDPGGGDFPRLVECRVEARNAILPWAFTRHAVRAFDAGAKKLEFDIDVCLWATGKVSSSWSPYEWLIVSYVEGRAFRMRAGRPMMISPREVLRPI